MGSKKISIFLILVSLAPLLSFSNSFAGGWTLPKGRLWIKSAVYFQSTKSRFCTAQDALSPAFQEVGCSSAGHSAPFDPFVGGEVQALGVFTELMYGATGWLDFGVQVPFYSLQFTNLSDPDRPGSNSIGDIRFFGKLRLLEAPFIASIQVGAKSPTGKFDIDAEVVNVSENQWDFEFLGHLSKSLWPLNGYVSLGFGYRIRTDNPDFEHTMGNELIGQVEAGYNIHRSVMLKSTFDWLRGERPGIKSSGAKLLWRRELVTIAPSVIYMPGQDIQIEGSIRFPLRGRDFPDGPQFISGISYNFQLTK